jgi:flagellar motor protein MotB
MLRARGVDPGRLSTSGAGDTQPLADNHNAAGRARNRRVEIVVRAH